MMGQSCLEENRKQDRIRIAGASALDSEFDSGSESESAISSSGANKVGVATADRFECHQLDSIFDSILIKSSVKRINPKRTDKRVFNEAWNPTRIPLDRCN